MASFYDFTLTKANGEELKTADLKGKVVMVVNTATGCGFTPHYEPIENMYRNYHEKGLEIIDVPCNQFGHQTPGSDEEIHEFCTLHYNTTFPQMKKSDVNGANELPLYTYLKSQKGFEGFGKGVARLLPRRWLKLKATMTSSGTSQSSSSTETVKLSDVSNLQPI